MKIPNDKNHAFYGSKHLRERVQKDCKPIYETAGELKRIVGKRMLLIPATNGKGKSLKYLENKSTTKF